LQPGIAALATAFERKAGPKTLTELVVPLQQIIQSSFFLKILQLQILK